MGSGSRLAIAKKKYGIENFIKEILEFRNTREEIAELESEIVTEQLLNDDNCYNIRLGGEEHSTTGTATMKDQDGNIKQVIIGSEEYKNMVGSTMGMVACYDTKEHRYKQITKEEFQSDKNRYIGNTKGMVLVKSNDGYKLIDSCEYKNGNYQTIWTGKKHKNDSIEKMKLAHAKNKHQQGEKNSQYGTCWITNVDNVSKKINQSELSEYISNGWQRGRKYI